MRMNLQALPLAQKPDDRVAGNRATAGRQLNGHAFGTTDDHRHRLGMLALLDLLVRCQTTGQRRRQRTPQADIGIEFAPRFLAGIAQQPIPYRRGNFGRGDAQSTQLLMQHVFAEQAGPVDLLRLEELPDLAACPTGLDVLQPGRVGIGVRGGNDFDLVAVGQLGR